MKAVIMAGGEGTRLRPLTCESPKPMARLCGRPVLEYILDLLQKNGVTHAAITLKYLPQVISEYFPDGEYKGMKLEFFEEDEPLGTAGSVKNAAGMLDDDFVVISGDAMCDFDLSSAYEFHKEKGASATLLMSHVADPREYGLVVTEPSGRVRSFVEKPGWAQAVTDAVNTGIYIVSPACLSMIPSGKPYDFAKDLFPMIMGRGLPIYGYDADGYWCDIGDIGAYMSCQTDMLEGRVDCRIPGIKTGGIQLKSKKPAGNYKIIPPVYIGDGVRIGDSSVIGPYTVIDDGCSIGFASTIKNSVLLPDSYIGDRCELRGALICSGASLKRGAGMFEGSVAGSGAVVGRDASVSPGVCIWPGKEVENGVRAAANLKYGSARKGLFDDDGITGEIGVDITPEFCARLGAAVGSMKSSGRIGVADDGSAAAAALKQAVSSGVISTGTQVCDYGGCFESMFSFAVTFFGLDMGIFLHTAGARMVIKLVGAGGLTVGRSAERKLDSSFTTGELRRCNALDYKEPFIMTGVKLIYEQSLSKTAEDGLNGIGVTVRSSNKEVQKTLFETLRQLGCSEGNIKIHLDSSGRNVSFFDETGNYIDTARSLALGCIAAFEAGEDVAVPYDAPRVIEALAEKYRRRALRYLDCPTDDCDKNARELAKKQTFVRDGLENTIRILHYLRRNGIPLCMMTRKLPMFAVSVKTVPCRSNPGNLLRVLSQDAKAQGRGPSEGVLLSSGEGKVLLSPLKRGRGLRILAEAANMEMAEELCSVFDKKLRDNDVLDRNE